MDWWERAEAEWVACAHGSDDRASCFGCEFGESLGPHLPPKPLTKIRYSARFVEQYRALSGDHRFPLSPA